ncbi:MAG: Rab family GTPase [Candidatus Helarchaeota archaeon]
MSYDYKWKICVVGDPSVGKTTLMLQYTEKKFQELYIPTVGVQVSVKDVLVSREDNDEIAKVGLYIWDIAGQVKFARIRKLFYEGANAFIIVYDLTDKESFINTSRWYNDVSDILEEEIHGCLVGNKSDLPNRQISPKSGQLLADKMGLTFIETSAKTGENVDNLFTEIAHKIYDLINK